MFASMVLLCRQRPRSFKEQPETMRFEQLWPGHLARECHMSPADLSCIERLSDENVGTIPYALLIRPFSPANAEGSAYCSPLDWQSSEHVVRSLAAHGWHGGWWEILPGSVDASNAAGLCC